MKHVGNEIICMSTPFSISVTNNGMGITDRHSSAGLYIGTISDMGMTKYIVGHACSILHLRSSCGPKPSLCLLKDWAFVS